MYIVNHLMFDKRCKQVNWIYPWVSVVGIVTPLSTMHVFQQVADRIYIVLYKIHILSQLKCTVHVP